jgi:hypothetical protein
MLVILRSGNLKDKFCKVVIKIDNIPHYVGRLEREQWDECIIAEPLFYKTTTVSVLEIIGNKRDRSLSDQKHFLRASINITTFC